MARHWFCLVLAVVALYFLLDFANMSGWLIVMPRGRDPRVVGSWLGTVDGKTKRFVFGKDGSGEIWQPGASRPRRFGWGTEDGRLHAKLVFTDAWGRVDYPYKVESDGKVLRIGIRREYLGGTFLSRLTRLP